MTVNTVALERITLRYDASQDRIRVDGVSRDGEMRKFWLTRRLVGRLIAYFLQYEGVNESLRVECREASPMGSARSTGALQSDAPVTSPDNSPSYLIGEMDITQLADNIQMIFKSTDTAERLAFSLPCGSIEDWLTGVVNCYRTGEWGVSALETRVNQTDTTQKAGPITLH